ncbi:DUF5675 family protein [Dysgonomonas sp. ZJ279]|uniref:DUF5675 family protein n=1 Tax=Dysgonomonas sp. ZJ279 TaxID=2709796 RepID=UPI001C867429
MGILIHSGINEKDSAGCLIVGFNTVKGKVLQSRFTSDKLNTKLNNQKEITIEIV